jgi:streptomycin 3"-adenylyltransferase
VPELLGEQATDTRNVLRTLARGRHTLATGEIRSKDAAAEWAVGRPPSAHRPALARARAVYLGEEDERRDGVDAGGCAEYLVRMIGERQPA